MSKINNGGPAFPFCSADEAFASGMFLRDWFAGQALIGLCQADMGELEYLVSPDTLARTAYGMADAMLKAREVSKHE